jgi:pyruvate dehydrogenase E2 component (dihydrolipoamide acetyltransferase)
MARRLAARHGIDLETVTGTGRRGRIAKADVLALVSRPAAAATAPANTPDVRAMTPMRKAIARRLTEAKRDIPHFYVRRRVRADRLLARRAAAADPRPSVNDLLLEAVAATLIEVPRLNIQVHGPDIHGFASADVAVAVATDRGLLTPVVRGADRLSLAELSRTVADLAERTRTGRLTPEEFAGGSFTVSNLGPFGVEQFDAIINPPQGAILAVGAARPEPIDDDGAIRIVPVLHLSLSCDHRAIDGADAARFLAALARRIEAP